MLRKIASIILAVLMLLPSTVLFTYAYEPDFQTITFEGGEALRFPEDVPTVPAEKKEASVPGRRLLKSVSPADTPYTFYSQLTSDVQREIYNEVVAAHGGLDAVTNDSSSAAAEIIITKDDGSWDFTDQAGHDALAQNAFSCIVPALSAVGEDRPEFFWIGTYGANFSYKQRGNKFQGVFTLKIELNTEAYANWGVIRNYYNSLLDSVASFKVTGNNRYQKVKSIHDTICSMVEYDPNYNNSNMNPTAHEPVSVFNSPFLAVCEGYAEAFKLICDREAIPCITIVGLGNGGGHKWNYVKMDDGNWYGMDVTWDDQSYTFYDYFLAGSSSLDAYFGKKTFSGSHQPTGQVYDSEFSLTYPTLSTVSYVSALPNLNTKSTFDAVNGFMYISKSATLNSQFASSSDYTISYSGNTTGGSVTINNTNSGTKKYTVVRWGDVNADNAVNRNGDYNKMKNVVSGTDSLADGSANFRAADFDGDGAVDAFDMYYMDMYLNGNIDR